MVGLGGHLCDLGDACLLLLTERMLPEACMEAAA